VTLTTPGSARYAVDVIDTWNMTIDRAPDPCEGTFTVDLPARPYHAVRLTRIELNASADSFD
jgi:hypothetical protein